MGRSFQRAGRILSRRPLRLKIIGSLHRPMVVLLIWLHIRDHYCGRSGGPMAYQLMWRAYTRLLAAPPAQSIRPAGGSARSLVTEADWDRVILHGFKSSSWMRAPMFSPFTSRLFSPPVWGWTVGSHIRYRPL